MYNLLACSAKYSFLNKKNTKLFNKKKKKKKNHDEFKEEKKKGKQKLLKKMKFERKIFLKTKTNLFILLRKM